MNCGYRFEKKIHGDQRVDPEFKSVSKRILKNETGCHPSRSKTRAQDHDLVGLADVEPMEIAKVNCQKQKADWVVPVKFKFLLLK